MSKTITIKEDRVSKNFTVKKLRTNLQGGGTCDWVLLDEVNEYVELEELSVTENGIYYPTEKVGLSKVVVNVDGGGGGGGEAPSGTEVVARAVEDLTAGDCVYIISGGAGGEASVVATSFSDGTAYTRVCASEDYVYFTDKNSFYNNKIFRVPMNNLTASPETYMTDLLEIVMLDRNLLCWRDSDYQDHTKNLDINQTISARITTPGQFSKDYVFGNNSFYKLSDMAQVMTYSGISYKDKMADSQRALHLVRQRYYLYLNGVFDHDVMLDTDVSENPDGMGYNVFNNKIICFKYTTNQAGFYEVGYFDLDADDGVWHDIFVSDNVKLQADAPFTVKFNREATIAFIMCGSKGLALIYPDMSVVVYTNIISNDANSQMFGDYFWDATAKKLYTIPQSNTIGKTSEKNHIGSLGYVQRDVAQGATGTAIVLFS